MRNSTRINKISYNSIPEISCCLAFIYYATFQNLRFTMGSSVPVISWNGRSQYVREPIFRQNGTTFYCYFLRKVPKFFNIKTKCFQVL